MKRKRADHANWSRVTKKRFVMTYIDTREFRGYATLLRIDEVREPLVMKYPDGDVCIVDKGYIWLQLFPQGAHYTITINFDVQGQFVRAYIDIIKSWYLDEYGVLWYDDLYLDIDVSPDGAVDILDVDELDDALRQGLVSPIEYDLAWREATSIVTAIEEDMFPLLWSSELYRDMLVEMLQI